MRQVFVRSDHLIGNPYKHLRAFFYTGACQFPANRPVAKNRLLNMGDRQCAVSRKRARIAVVS